MLISYLNPLGEGKHVRDWLRDEIFDITAFPDKHPDGKFGLHYNRMTKLSAKQYFNQRIMHHDPRFRKDPEYIFVAEQLCTRQALERQISISARRGSLQKSDQGPSHYKLGANSDSFNIFQKIPGTPSYYKLFRNETFARIEQKGKFHCFWTLSCGEKQWPEVWAAILREEGYNVKYIDVSYNGTFEEILVDNIPLSEFIEKKIPNVSSFMKDHFVLLTRLFDSRVKAFLTHILKNSGIESYSYRIEFQLRGMPHVHGIGWFSKDIVEKYINQDGSFKENVSQLVEKWVSVSLQNDDTDLNDLVQKVQVHKHRRSCLKQQNIYDQSTSKEKKLLLEESCRYGFPKPPSEKTIIADLSPDDIPEKELEIYENVLKKVRNKLSNIKIDEEDMSLDEFLKSIDMEGQHDLYYKALKVSKRGKVTILMRTVRERMVNNYVQNFLRAWEANLDFQICLDNYAVVTYITDYLTKTDMRLTKMLKKALKENQSKDDFQIKNNLKKVFFTNRQQCVSESSYMLIPGLDLKGSNVKTKFVASGFPEERHGMIRRIFEEEEEDDDENYAEVGEHKKAVGFKIEGRKGTFVQSNMSIHDKYGLRPPVLYYMTLAEFSCKFDTCSWSTIRDQKVEFNVDRVSDMIGNLTAFDSNAELPKFIHLIDGSYMKIREQSYILRIHSSKKKDSMQQVYGELLLFLPWINEVEDLCRNKPTEMIQLFNNNRDLIESIKKKIFPHSSTLEILTGILDSENFERPSHLYETLDGEGEQQNEDDIEGLEPLDTSELPDPDDYNNTRPSSSKEKVIMKRIDLSEKDISSMYQHARSLSLGQKIVFDKFIHYIRCLVIQHNGSLIEARPPRIIVNGGKMK